MRNKTVTFFLILYSSLSFAQNIAIGEWRDHLSYRKGVAVAEGNNKIYCATLNALFAYNKIDNSLERLNKVSGLNGVRITAMDFNSYTNSLLISYEDANIDILNSDNSITNLSDIKRQLNLGNKIIRNIFFINQYAYLACGFGIVVVDMERKEIKDTYKFGPNGAFIDVYDVTATPDSIYAATESGVYKASLAEPNLIYYGSWNKVTGLPNGPYNTIAYLNDKVYANFYKKLTTDPYLIDTVYVYNMQNHIWSKFLDENGNALTQNIKKMKVSNNHLILALEWYVNVFDNVGVLTKQISSYGFTTLQQPMQAILDGTNTVWIADDRFGLVKATSNNACEPIFPNGPRKGTGYFITQLEDKIWVAPGILSANNGFTYNNDGISSYENATWNSIPDIQAMDSLFHIIDIAIDPKNKNHFYAASFGTGLIEVNNNNVVNVYNTSNSILQSRPEYRFIAIGGVKYDDKENLWIVNSYVGKCLVIKKKDGTWKPLDFSAFGVNNTYFIKGLYITQSGQKWINTKGNGLLVYNDNSSFANPSPLNTKKITVGTGKGDLPSNNVFSILQDKQGELWIGTDKGIVVFYSPDDIFTATNWDAQPIYIEQEGQLKKLLEPETVTAMAVDGANRKWIGTLNSGVFLLSEDGTKEVHHFTAENSPLLSNQIYSIHVEPTSGEVFFGTENGIISYRSTATEGSENFNNVYAYPNPVREGYEGSIAIKGLVSDVDVKITDIAGNIVYKTKALGGQAIWDGKTFKGEKVQTGVYLVFCSNEDGSKTFVTKILFIN